MTEKEMRDAILEIVRKGSPKDGIAALTDATAILFFGLGKDSGSLEVLVALHVATLREWFDHFRTMALKEQYSSPAAAEIAARYDL